MSSFPREAAPRAVRVRVRARVGFGPDGDVPSRQTVMIDRERRGVLGSIASVGGWLARSSASAVGSEGGRRVWFVRLCGWGRGRPGRVGSRAAAPRVCSGDCEKEQVFFTNRSLEASWVNSRFFPHRRTRRVACRRFAALFRVAGVGRDRDRDGGTSSVARVSALLPPCGRSLTCIRTNRQKAGKGFSQTGAACVVVTPHAREEAAAAATKRETKPEAAIREAAARARAPREGRSTYRATRERGRRD